MSVKVPKQQTSQGILNIPATVRAQEIPHEICAERESFGHGNADINESECFQDFYRQLLSEDDVALIDSVIAKVGNDFDHCDIFNYIDPELDALRDDGMNNLMNTIDSGMGLLENNLNTSIGTATENYALTMLTGLVQPQQSEIEQQKTYSQLQEELSHLKQVNSQLQQELNCFKASETKPQQSLEMLPYMEQQKLPQVDQESTVYDRIHEIDAQGGIATVNNTLPLSSSDLFRPKKLQRFPNEDMQQHAEHNEEIVLQSETIPMIDPSAQVVKPSNKRPPTRNLRKPAKQTRRCSQVSVDQEINDGIKYHDEKDKDERDDVDASVRLNNSKKVEGGKPHLCNVCNKSFGRKHDLLRHSLCHTGERPHLCNVCNKSFRRKTELSKHIISKVCDRKNQLKQQLFFCDYCGKSFSKKSNLKSHCLPCYKNRRAGTSSKSSY